jgi:hypothetical protein
MRCRKLSDCGRNESTDNLWSLNVRITVMLISPLEIDEARAIGATFAGTRAYSAVPEIDDLIERELARW